MRYVSDEERIIVQNQLLKLLVAFKNICVAEGIWYSLAFGTTLGAVRHNGFIPWDTDADVFIMLPDKEKFRKAFNNHKPKGIRLIDCSLEKHCLQSHDSLVFEEKTIMGEIHLDIFQLVGAPSDKTSQNKFAKYAHYADKVIRSKYVNIYDCKPKNKPIVFLVKCMLFLIPDKILKKNIYNREYKYDFEKSDYILPLSGYGRGRECLDKVLFSKMIPVDFCGEQFDIPANYDAYLRQIYGDDYIIPKKY